MYLKFTFRLRNLLLLGRWALVKVQAYFTCLLYVRRVAYHDFYDLFVPSHHPKKDFNYTLQYSDNTKIN